METNRQSGAFYSTRTRAPNNALRVILFIIRMRDMKASTWFEAMENSVMTRPIVQNLYLSKHQRLV